MPSTYSPSLRIELIGDGEQNGIWGQTTNNNLGELVEQAITGITTVDVTAGNVVLTSFNGAPDEARSSVLSVIGTPGVTRIITIPNVPKNYVVQNDTANIVQIKTVSGTAFSCPPSSHSYINCNASNVVVGRSITTQANAITASSTPFNSPAFTGVPTAPTATTGTNTTQISTTAFVQAAIALIPTPTNVIPSGTRMLFQQTAAPTGWTKITSFDNAALRVVNGAAGSGGSVGFTSAFSNQNVSSTALSAAQMPSHAHSFSGATSNVNIDHIHSGATDGVGDHVHTYTVIAAVGGSSYTGGGAGTVTTTTGGAGAHAHSFSSGGMNTNQVHGHTYSGATSAEGSGASHTHSINLAVQYVDIIIASRD